MQHKGPSFFIVLTLLSALLSSSAWAQSFLTNTYVMPFAGYQLMDSNSPFQNGFVAGAAVRQELTPYLSLQGRAGLIRSRNARDYRNEIENIKFIEGHLLAPFGWIHTKHITGRLIGSLGAIQSGLEPDPTFRIGLHFTPYGNAEAQPQISLFQDTQLQLTFGLEKALLGPWGQ